jgi:hypothetical protein
MIGDPGRSRTCDLKLRKLTLCPSELRDQNGGESGIRTHVGFTQTGLANRRLQPLGHLTNYSSNNLSLKTRLSGGRRSAAARRSLRLVG